MASVVPTSSSAESTAEGAARASVGIWIPCTCACPTEAHAAGQSKSKTILVRITPIAIAESDKSIKGFRVHLADPSSGKVWVDVVDSISLLRERKSAFAPRLLIPLDKLAVTLAQTLADAAITKPYSSTNVNWRSRNALASSSSSNDISSNKMLLDVEWIEHQQQQQDQEPDHSQALVHLKCTQRTASDQRFSWTFIATQVDPSSAAQILASDLLDPIFRVLHWQILETNHLSFQLDQAKRDLTLARSLLADPNAVRERAFPPASIPKDRRDIDYTTVFSNQTRWSQALLITHPAATFDLVAVQSRPPPPSHAQSQPVFSVSHTMSAPSLPAPRAVHSSPTLGPANIPSSDIGQPPPSISRLPPSDQTRVGLPARPPRTALLDLLLSSSQPHPPNQSQSQLQGPTLNSDPFLPSSDVASPSPSSTSASSSSHRPTTSLFDNLLSRTGSNPSTLRPQTKSPITLELTDSQSHSQAQPQSELVVPEPSPTPPPPLSPRSLLASLPPSLVIPSTVPVPIAAQGPLSSQRHTVASSSSATTTQFTAPNLPASASRVVKRAREDESRAGAGQGEDKSTNANGGAELDAAAVSKPKKKKQKVKGLF
ncbi:hypothetical protein BCR44DRAFT_1013868 [Catenaria anguillulae PL171]|uniref:Uncharacterized protein n=1 Tax=Catenaria anguillulae PL171 TaxID=765915 RepID=A0A1Y2HTH9_9FUNG|nr:hypothetical protein BCR44DRAFT_1013868 [Catenaria anguillulae PL171]